MSSNLRDPDAGISLSLPQCGFGAEIDFDTLIKANRFLFRVYTPKERSPFADDTDPFFVAPRFDEQVARSPVDLPNVKFSEPVVGSYAEVARHMEWTTRTSSSYISTSFSFSWAIWEAVRRYHLGVKKDVEIAIIDAPALGGRAATAVQLLKKSSPRERNEQFWKWLRFSQDSQSVLVYGMVPRTAVLASIPLLQILRKMPSYFLRKDIQIIDGNPLHQVAWDYTKRKHSYQQFCHDMTKMFLARPIDVRLRDSTAGAVRLALSFLRPFFHNVVQDDFDIAISYLRTLAITISEWPGGCWVRDHPEIRQIVEVMVLALGEELREKYSQQKQEISRLQVVINGLEQTIKAQNEEGSRYIVDDVEIDSDGDFEVEFDEADETTLVARLNDPPAMHRRPSLQMSVAVLPRIPISFQTPITPPESPRNSLFIPTVTVPLGDVISTQFSFKPPPAEDVTQGQEVSSAKSSASSEEPASPPPTPPLRSPVFSLPKLPVIEGDVAVDERGGLQDHGANDAPDTIITAEDPEVVNTEPEDDPGAQEEMLSVPYADHEEDDAEKTDHEEEPDRKADIAHEEEDEDEHEFSAPPSPSHSWVAIPSLGSPFSSPRSSIMSIETLCEPNDFSLKRLSFATSYSDSFDFFPSMRSVGMSSRTVSFSEFSPRISLLIPPQIDPLAIPLPPSPVSAHESLPPSSVSTSTSSSDASTSTDSSAPTDLTLPFITPLPPSPTLSFGSLPSSLSRSSSSSSSVPSTPVLPVNHSFPAESATLIIPPKPRISLLSPLPEQDVEDDDDDRRSIRSAGVSETASYLVTGFLVGAFITLFLFSTQRRTMLYLT